MGWRFWALAEGAEFFFVGLLRSAQFYSNPLGHQGFFDSFVLGSHAKAMAPNTDKVSDPYAKLEDASP
jgi:hypothetical protein